MGGFDKCGGDFAVGRFDLHSDGHGDLSTIHQGYYPCKYVWIVDQDLGVRRQYY
jgi:hypothetical protein